MNKEEREQEARDRANPFKNRQLAIVLLSIIGIGTGLGIGIAIQGEADWWMGTLGFYTAAGLVWIMSFLLRHNP